MFVSASDSPEVLRGPALGALQDVGEDVSGGVGLDAVVVGLLAELLLEVVEERLGARVLRLRRPEGGRHAVLRSVRRVLQELREREAGRPADEGLRVDVQLLRLPHQERSVHQVGDHVEDVGPERLDLLQDRLEVDGAGLVALGEDDLHSVPLAPVLHRLRGAAAEIGVLIKDGDRLRLRDRLEEAEDAHVVEAGGRVHPVDVFPALLGDLVGRARHDEVGDLVLFGDARDRVAALARVLADHDRVLVHRDELLDDGRSGLGLAARVLDVEGELHPLHAALGVDLLDRHLVRLLLHLAELGFGPRQRQGDAHREGLGLGEGRGKH